jgi:hypothetical protein
MLKAKKTKPKSKTLIKDTRALIRLAKRLAKRPEQINNSRLPAGSAMYFYCKICGHFSDMLPESYTCRPQQYCDDCTDLKKVNPDITDASLVQMAKECNRTRK